MNGKKQEFRPPQLTKYKNHFSKLKNIHPGGQTSYIMELYYEKLIVFQKNYIMEKTPHLEVLGSS